MKQYLDLARFVLENGEEKEDRTGTGIISVFGMQTKYDLRDGFPMVTSKKVSYKNIVAELLWFLAGETNIYTPIPALGGKGLHDLTKIWDAWAAENGDLGPVYGKQWVAWESCACTEKDCDKKIVNQVQKAIDAIKNNPTSRRIIVSAWNPGLIEEMALPPCHAFFQFNVTNDRLDLQLYQRSADIALGVPYNIASYSTLLAMVAQECNLEPGIFTHTLGDAHIYSNHVEGIKEQLRRKTHPLPTLKMAKKPFWDLTIDDFELENYVYEPRIKFPIAV